MKKTVAALAAFPLFFLLYACGDPAGNIAGPVPDGSFDVDGHMPNAYLSETLEGASSGAWALTRTGETTLALTGSVLIVDTLTDPGPSPMTYPPRQALSVCSINLFTNWDRALFADTLTDSLCNFAIGGTCHLRVHFDTATGASPDKGLTQVQGSATVTSEGGSECNAPAGSLMYTFAGTVQK